MCKKLFIFIGFLFILLTTSCSKPTAEATLLKEPMSIVNNIDINEENYKSFLNKLSLFSSKLSEEYYDYYDINDNLSISPLSIYMALALITECSNESTRAEVLNALGLTYDEVLSFTKVLYAKSAKEYYSTNENGDKKLISKESLTNSIWIQDGLNVNNDCINSLASDYYCYSYQADFKNKNRRANQAIKEFIYDNTNGLINSDFELSVDTLIALINTLYLKDVWDIYDDLGFTSKKYTFTNADNSSKSLKLLQGKYNIGKIYESESFSHFYTKTLNGYNIKFIVPKDGYSINDIFNYECLSYVNSITNYNAVDDEKMEQYYTRCLFPEFEASCDNDITGLLSERFNISNLFNESCDFSNVTNEDVYCSSIIHKTKLEVNKEGIEGAAVTIAAMDGSAAPGAEYKRVYYDFIVDKAFGYILTDSNNVMLFSGVINNI